MRIKIKASYFLDEPERIVDATEIREDLYVHSVDQLCDSEGNRLWPVTYHGELLRFS